VDDLVDLDESNVKADLVALRLVDADAIRPFVSANPSDFALNDPDEHLDVKRAVESILRGFGDSAFNRRGVRRNRYDDALELVRFNPQAETGVVAIRCGEDRFALHHWTSFQD
jgi:hypothetical protein